MCEKPRGLVNSNVKALKAGLIDSVAAIPTMTEEYKANEYYRQAQRFVYPLYKKDGMGGFSFSSTATFATYKGRFFCIFAAHALTADEETVENIGMLTTDGNFVPLSVSCKAYKIYRDHDIVICISDTPFEPRNHFNLAPRESATEFNTEGFGWIGFPQKKAVQTIHKSKASPDKIINHLSVASDGRPVWSNAKFLMIGAMLESKSESVIIGRFENVGVNYEYEGFKQQGYSPRGMSGGALFYGPKKFHSTPQSLEDLFLFAGIGLEYDRISIKGVPKERIISLIEEMLKLEADQSNGAPS